MCTHESTRLNTIGVLHLYCRGLYAAVQKGTMHTPHSPTIESYRKQQFSMNYNIHICWTKIDVHSTIKERHIQKKTRLLNLCLWKQVVVVPLSLLSHALPHFYISLVSWLVSHCLSLCFHLYTKLLHVINFCFFQVPALQQSSQ